MKDGCCSSFHVQFIIQTPPPPEITISLIADTVTEMRRQFLVSVSRFHKLKLCSLSTEPKEDVGSMGCLDWITSCGLRSFEIWAATEGPIT